MNATPTTSRWIWLLIKHQPSVNLRTFIPHGTHICHAWNGAWVLRRTIMSINLIRFLASQKKKAERYHTDKLRYRGVVYKEIG